MPRCSICAIKRKTHLLCSTCKGNDKKICLGCLSNMLVMNKIQTLDCAVHWSCPFCIQELDLKVLNDKKNKWFTNSHQFLTASNKLRIAYINALNEDREQLMHDMEEMIAVDTMQQEIDDLESEEPRYSGEEHKNGGQKK